MNREEWDRVEQALSGVFGRIRLKVDGREVTFRRGLITKNRLGIMTYVDGTFKGAWMLPSHEAPESMFLRPQSRFVYTQKERKRFKRIRKKTLKELKIDPDKKMHSFTPFWNSVGSIRKHYERTFKDIQLLETGGI